MWNYLDAALRNGRTSIRLSSARPMGAVPHRQRHGSNGEVELTRVKCRARTIWPSGDLLHSSACPPGSFTHISFSPPLSFLAHTVLGKVSLPWPRAASLPRVVGCHVRLPAAPRSSSQQVALPALCPTAPHSGRPYLLGRLPHILTRCPSAHWAALPVRWRAFPAPFRSSPPSARCGRVVCVGAGSLLCKTCLVQPREAPCSAPSTLCFVTAFPSTLCSTPRWRRAATHVV